MIITRANIWKEGDDHHQSQYETKRRKQPSPKLATNEKEMNMNITNKWELEKGIKHRQQIIKRKHKWISLTNENQKKETNVITAKRSKHFYQVTLPRVDAQSNGSFSWQNFFFLLGYPLFKCIWWLLYP
jgi:uncharacterized protein YprB with RNaseH-like and TPR domain